MAMISVAHKINPSHKKGLFLGMFGVSLVAFAAGFDSCFFNPDTTDACVTHAQSWIDDFQRVGDHLVQWVIALFTSAFSG